MTETIQEQKEHAEWMLKTAKGALQSCVKQEREWNQKQKEAYEMLVEAVKESEKHRLNRIEMEEEVEKWERELKEFAYEEEVHSGE